MSIQMPHGLLVGCGLMLAAAAAKLCNAAPAVALALWIGGVFVSVWHTWSRNTPAVSSKGNWAGLGVVLAAAVVLLWHLESVPRQVHGDEWAFSAGAVQFFHEDPARGWFAVRGFIMGPFWALLGFLPFVCGHTILTARLSDALLGIAAVALMFDAVRRAVSVQAAVVCALLLAMNHCHIAYARTAIGYAQTDFVVTLLCNLLVRWWFTPTPLLSVALGLATAVGMQTALASLLTAPLLGVTLGVLLLLHPAERRQYYVPLAVLVATFAAAVSPFAVAAWQQRGEFLARPGQVSLFAPGVLASAKAYYRSDSTVHVYLLQLWHALTAFYQGHDAQPAYGVLSPMADQYTAALMLPGVIYCCWYARRVLSVMAMVFVVGYLVVGLGLHYAPAYQRALGAVPFGTAIAGLGLVQCANLLTRRRWLQALLLSGALGVCAWANYTIYFVDTRTTLLTGDSDAEAGWVAREFAASYRVHLVDWFAPGAEPTRLITAGVPVSFNPLHDTLAYVNAEPVTGRDLFIVHGDDTAARDALVARFPTGRLETRRRHPGYGPTLFLIFVDSGAPKAVAAQSGNKPG